MEEQKNELKDLIIIGAAAAGCAAAVYAARRNLNFIVVTKDIGGEVALSGQVNNWPGILDISGFELAQKFYAHAKSYGVKFDEGFEISELKKKGATHIITAKNFLGETREYRSKAIIIASGIHPRQLGAINEENLKNKGVTYCTVCDGPLFKGKTTATVGAGNSALESALMMAGIASKVYILTRYPNTRQTNSGFPRGENILIDKIKAMDNVEILYEADTKEIVGTDSVESLIYEDMITHAQKQIEVQGVMVHIGMIPNSQFVSCGKKNALGEIEVNTKCETDCSGVFAAGDVTNVPFKQIAIAAGHGVTAALSAIEYINKWEA
ncbi:MAG: FAD-dependent oxidoreductase [Candidatus Magasanikbacteria bacterium]|nr:FAD-dependent oxidoreductase [Candidatus Magasanikbacteria bacterium]